MKSLKESLLDNLDAQMHQGDIDVNYKISCKAILEFIEANYKLYDIGHITINDMFVIHKNPDKDGKFLVDSKVSLNLKDSSLTTLEHKLFKWNTVFGEFTCINCNRLKSLKGAPTVVKSGIRIEKCNSLESLEGLPKKCDRSICIHNCNSLKKLNGISKTRYSYEITNCNSLESLEGLPNIVYLNLILSGSGLKSLKGAPTSVYGIFSVQDCKYLQSLDYFPKTVKNAVYVDNCGGHFTEEDVRAVCDAKRKIYADKN